LHAAGFEDLKPVTSLPGLFPEPIRVFGVPDPLPRAYAVSRHRSGEGMGALRAVLDPGFDPAREVVVPDRPGAPSDPAAGEETTVDPTTGSVTIVARRPDRVRLEADLRRPAYVVLLESFDPGWRATVDGRAAEVLPANAAFCAVTVPGGRHTVEYAYRPGPLYAGLGTAAASGVAAIVLCAWPRRPRAGGEPERTT